MIEADARELGEGDRQQREVHAGDGEAEGEKADHQAERHAQRDGEPQPGPRSDTVVEEERPRRVRADADVERMPERELAREAHHHVPCLAGVGEVEDQRRDRERVVADHKRQRDENRERLVLQAHAQLRLPQLAGVRVGRTGRTSLKRGTRAVRRGR